MRKILLLFILSALATVAWGQSYSYRYWFDNDETTAATGSATGETQFVIDLKAIPSGYHTLHVQAKDANGVWSSVHTRNFQNMQRSSTATTARYWIDNDLSTMREVSRLNEDFDDTEVHEGILEPTTIVYVDASLLTLGYHTIHYQTFSADGIPSATRTRSLYVDKMHRALLTASISIDGGAPATYSLANGDIVIDISRLDDGEHSLSVSLSDYRNAFIGTRTGVFNVLNRMTGDVNADGSVDIGDIVMVISVMTGTETDAAIVARADVNSDGAADIGDIVSIIGIMTSQPAGARAHAAARIWQQANSDGVSMTMDGNALHLSLDNSREYTAFQFLLTLPEGTSPDDASISSLRGQGHVATVEPVGNGQYLVMGYSLGNKAFSGFSGQLLTLGLKGRQTVQAAISDVVFADAKGNTYRLTGSEATGIDGIEDGKQAMDGSVHDLQGRKVTIGNKGIYLIGNRKVVVK